MTCIVLKQDRYYKMMAGITCFCCPNKVVFSIPTESQPPHAVFCVLVVSIYSCCEYRQLGGGKLRCPKFLRMAVVLCSFKFVIHGKKLLRNNCCFWLRLQCNCYTHYNQQLKHYSTQGPLPSTTRQLEIIYIIIIIIIINFIKI